eukprot:2041580-Heterocapsa_arctica.AAC.1
MQIWTTCWLWPISTGLMTAVIQMQSWTPCWQKLRVCAIVLAAMNSEGVAAHVCKKMQSRLEGPIGPTSPTCP